LTTFLQKLAKIDAVLMPFWHFFSTFYRDLWFVNRMSKKGAKGQRGKGHKTQDSGQHSADGVQEGKKNQPKVA